MQLNDAISADTATNMAGYTQPALLVPRLAGTDMAGIIKELSVRLHRECCVPDMLQFYHAVLNREYLIPTAMDFGVAIPHARVDGPVGVQFAMGRCVPSLVWGAKGALEVEWVFLVAVPSTDAASYLHFLSGLAKFGRQPDLRARAQAAAHPSELYALLEEVRVRQA